MNESEWLASEDPAAMLSLLTGNTVGPGSPVAWRQSMPGNGIDRLSDRKLRLFACACVRLEWGALTDQRSRDAVTTAEAYAEGMVSSDGLYEASFAAWSVCDEKRSSVSTMVAERWAWMASGRDAEIPNFLLNNDRPGGLSDQADILRDIVGNPFRPVTLPSGPKCKTCHGSGTYTVQVHNPGLSSANGYGAATTYSEWRGCRSCGGDYDRKGTGSLPCPWLTPQVISLAQAAYDERLDDGTLDPFRLALLSDALEEAGCPSRVETEGPEILADSREVCPYCSRWPADSPYGENGWVKCKRWKSEVPGDDYGKCRKCNRLWKVGYDTVSIVTYPPHPLLAHLRSPGPHYRGCWAVDLVLGKE